MKLYQKIYASCLEKIEIIKIIIHAYGKQPDFSIPGGIPQYLYE